jgi:tetratricopeptide (TPR) repeat protein
MWNLVLRLGASRRVVVVVLAIASALACSIISEAQPDGSTRAQIELHFRQAENYLAENVPELAAKEFQAVLAISPGNATALANLGAIAFLQGDCPGAASYFRGALEHEPTLIKAQALLGICERRLGDPSAQPLLESSFAQLEDKNVRTQVGIELASSYYEQGDLEHTSSTLGTLLEVSPDSLEVLYMAQRVYQEMADGTLNKLAILAPHSARMQQVVAEHLINAGNAPGAIEHYRAALKINPRLAGVHLEIGESILQSSTSESALADASKEFSEAIKNDGDSASIEEQLGLIAALSSELDQSFQHYKRAYSLNAHDTAAQLGIATILMEKDKPAEAMPYLQNVVKADPMNTDARYRLAMAYRSLGQSEEFRKQIAIFRESKAVNSQVEELYSQMNKPIPKTPSELKSEGVKTDMTMQKR